MHICTEVPETTTGQQFTSMYARTELVTHLVVVQRQFFCRSVDQLHRRY